jgi:hypothetical protein
MSLKALLTREVSRILETFQKAVLAGDVSGIPETSEKALGALSAAGVRPVDRCRNSDIAQTPQHAGPLADTPRKSPGARDRGPLMSRSERPEGRDGRAWQGLDAAEGLDVPVGEGRGGMPGRLA